MFWWRSIISRLGKEIGKHFKGMSQLLAWVSYTAKGSLSQPKILEPETSAALARVTAKTPAAGGNISSAPQSNRKSTEAETTPKLQEQTTETRQCSERLCIQDLADRKPWFQPVFLQSHWVQVVTPQPGEKGQSPQQGSFVLSSDLITARQIQSGPVDVWAGQCLRGRGGEA